MFVLVIPIKSTVLAVERHPHARTSYSMYIRMWKDFTRAVTQT